MSLYVNPFYARASEQQHDSNQFVSMFGPGALDMLPEVLWDRLIILRSAPGAGKTSLMRLFTVDSLERVRKSMKPSDPLYEELLRRGALTRKAAQKLGVLISLRKDYRSLLDLPYEPDQLRRLFLRLLDVRTVLGVLRATLALSNLRFPEDVHRITLAPSGGDDVRVEAAINRMGGPSGQGIVDYSRTTERSIIRMLDALVESDFDPALEGHSELYSLRILSGSDLIVDGKVLHAQPLLMFDDGHELEASQRAALLNELRAREAPVARWYAERFEALSNQELLADVGREERDFVLVDLDAIARGGDGPHFQRGRYDKILTDIARRRAAPTLSNYAQENEEFLGLLEEDREHVLGEGEAAVLATLTRRVNDVAGGDSRYQAWITRVGQLTGFQAAVAVRETEILIHRDQDRQRDLFAGELSEDEIGERSSGAIREAAALSVASEFKVPYYAGRDTVIRLGAHNAEQFLNLCGALFDEMLVDVSLGRRPYLSVRRQHRVLFDASERYWTNIAATVLNGRDVQALVSEIVSLARADNAKPKVPYPPGVTGTALTMGERAMLLDPSYRLRTPGAERLFTALGSAVAEGILQVELNYSVKNGRYMVLYLNRLLCPRFWLPLGLGSFREKRLSIMLGWMRKLPPTRAYQPERVEELAL